MKTSSLLPSFILCTLLACLLFLPAVISDEEFVYTPVNSIIMYGGVASDFTGWGWLKNDTNWHLCNGQNGTPDMLTKFVVGYDEENNSYDEMFGTGGTARVLLLEDEMPYHTHDYDDYYHYMRYRGLTGGLIPNAESFDLHGVGQMSDGAGGFDSHENRPQFIIVMYIMRMT